MSTYSTRVSSIYQSYVDSKRMRPINLGNIKILMKLETFRTFDNFFKILEKESRNLRNSSQETPLICLLVVCCISYDFNELTTTHYTNATIHGFWKCMTKSESTFRMLNPSSPAKIDQLLSQRTSMGFQTCHMTGPSRSISTSSKTSRQDLSNRLLKIGAGGRGFKLNIDTNMPIKMTSLSCVYKDYPSMILDVCGYQSGAMLRHHRSNPCKCTVLSSCIDVETGQSVPICLKHGVHGNTRIATLKTHLAVFLLNSSQCMFPNIHCDRCMLLPSKIRSEMSKLLSNMGYLETRSIVVEDEQTKILSHNISQDHVEITEFRQYICIGKCTTGDNTIVVWMIRPTVNYLECVFLCKSNDYKSLVSLIKGVVQFRSGYHDISHELGIKHTYLNEDLMEVNVSGTLAPYFMTSEVAKDLNAKIKTVSIGGSRMNVTVMQIDGIDQHKIIPIMINIDILKSMTASCFTELSGMMIFSESKKVVIKFRRIVDGNVVGPSLTLGNYGGFQWIGAPSMFASTMDKFLSHSNYMMSKQDFVRCVSNSIVGVSQIYPGGIPRRPVII